MTREIIIVVIVQTVCQSAPAELPLPIVTTIRVPNDGIQPQVAVDKKGDVHLIYYKGEAGSGDIYYVRSANGGKSFSEPIRVNSQPASAIAAGTIRGAHLALGKNDRSRCLERLG